MEPPAKEAYRESMIRLLILTDTHVGGEGGTEQHLKMLINGMDPSRFQVDVVQLGERPPQRTGRLGVARLHHLPTGRLLSLHGWQRFRELLGFVRSSRHHCVLSFFESSDILAVALSYFGGVRCILSSRRDTGFRYSRKLRLAYRYLDRRFRRVVAPSEAVRDSLVVSGMPKEQVALLPNGVDVERFVAADGGSFRRELGVGKERILLGNVARLSEEKDHQTLLKALQVLHRCGKEATLVIVGEGGQREKLAEEAMRLGLRNHVRFLGARSDIPTILAGIDIFVLSSITEGMSNAILEAMAAAKPVVATRVGGNSELVQEGETGYLVAAGDDSALAWSIGKLVGNPRLRRQMGLAGRKRVSERYSAHSMVKRYEALIEQGVGGDG